VIAGSKAVLAGWGGYPRQFAQTITPLSPSGCLASLRSDLPLIARGMGRSYGDSALAGHVVLTHALDHFIAFDPSTGVLTAEAGVLLRDVIRLTLQQGWFLPVSPGTSFVSLGGAIASDVHGKNHHTAGCFSQHVISLTILLGSGEQVTASPTELPELFYATCGGMGLTGIILSATIQLAAVRSVVMHQQTLRCSSLEAVCQAFSEHSQSPYSVAWIDCLAIGLRMGRSVLILGRHAQQGGLGITLKHPMSVPAFSPDWLLGRPVMRVFNSIYYAKAMLRRETVVGLVPYFYPLDALGHWNRLYGKNGFLQYQCVVPEVDGLRHLRELLRRITQTGLGSFLAVLKKLGPANQNFLSFPMEGYTLALDFKKSDDSIALIRALDGYVSEIGGRVYLTKDAVMHEASFKTMYPRWQEFESVRVRYNAVGRFSSMQSRRLGLA